MAKKVSFDYDGVLTTKAGVETFDRWKATGDEMYILTARPERMMGPVYEFAREHGITRGHVIRTTVGNKWKMVNQYGLDKHVDNNQDELDLILKNTKAAAWNVTKLS